MAKLDLNAHHLEEEIKVVILPDGRMTRRNAARYLGHAEKTLAQWASKGIGPRYIKKGRTWYFRQDIDAWLASGQNKAGVSA